MKLFLPIKYLYSEQDHRIVDEGLMDAICKDFDTSWDLFPEFICDENEFLSLFRRSCPEGTQVIEDSILTIEIYDYYDSCFYEILNYCEEHQIPLNCIEEPEYTSGQTTLTFIRPEMGTKCVAVDEYHKILVKLEEIMSTINEADEEKSDTEIMIEISNHLERINPYSNLNSLTNWV